MEPLLIGLEQARVVGRLGEVRSAVLAFEALHIKAGQRSGAAQASGLQGF